VRSASPGRRRVAWYLAVALLGAVAYGHGLSSPHVPKNGDEYPYAHITRLTAASGRLLPLCSELPGGMRNTKPPLLFWQGIATTGWGRSFDLLSLRWPSVAYTLATALLLFLLGRRLRDAETGLVAALGYLAFFGTYRYGRPFLTSAPESFWLLVPLFALTWGGAPALASRVRVPALTGLALGIGLLYKSFALAVPAGLGLLLLHWSARRARGERLAAGDLARVGATLSLALAVFGLWFLLDPDPRAVWREFVIGENAGKFDLAGSYLPGLLWGRFSIAAFALGGLANAGLLLPPVLWLAWDALRRRRGLDESERRLWLWVLAFFAAFCLPMQRSGRYLLPAMPAVALLLALQWPRVARWAVRASLALGLLALLAAAGASLVLQRALPEAARYGAAHGLLLAVGLAVVAAGLLAPRLSAACVHAGAFLSLLALSSLLSPLDGPAGRFDPRAQQRLAGRDVWAPVDFIGKEEGYRFLLPGARVHGYAEQPGESADALLARYPAVVVRSPAGAPPCTGCRVVGERFDLRGRHGSQELRAMLGGRLLEKLLVREVLVERR
jgi:4-amino-4-deoxy-L-arabinose transferase-like glycosyltransferase